MVGRVNDRSYKLRQSTLNPRVNNDIMMLMKLMLHKFYNQLHIFEIIPAETLYSSKTDEGYR